jgi:hypothetical protein
VNDPTALLAQVRALGVSVRLNGDNIALRPITAVPDDIKAALRSAKPELLALLRVEVAAQPPVAQMPATSDAASQPRPRAPVNRDTAPPPLEPPASPVVPAWAPPPPRPYRIPSWSDASDIPDAADTCSCCRLSSWWTEAAAHKGWRCCVCHPPLHLPPDAVRRAPLQGDRP